MSSPDQGFLVDKEDGQVPPEDNQVQADENAASYMDFSPLILSDVESGVEEIGSSDEEQRTYAQLTPVQPVQHVESDEDLAQTSNDEEAIFAAKLPKRGDFHHAYSSSNENDGERIYAELTPLQAVDHVLKSSVTIQSGEEFGQGSSNENYQEPIYAELTPMQAIDPVLKPSDIIQSVEEFQGTENLNQHRYKERQTIKFIIPT